MPRAQRLGTQLTKEFVGKTIIRQRKNEQMSERKTKNVNKTKKKNDVIGMTHPLLVSRGKKIWTQKSKKSLKIRKFNICILLNSAY